MKNTKNVTLIGALALLAITALGYLFVISPLLNSRTTKEAELVSAEEALVSAQQSLKTAQDFEQQYSQVKTIDEELKTNFPTTASVESLNASITDAAARAGLSPADITSITTQAPAALEATVPDPAADASDTAAAATDDTAAPEVAPEPSKLAQMSVSISAKGSTQSLAAFVRNLSDMSRVIRIDAVAFTQESDGTAILTISAVSYMYSSIEDPALQEQSEEPASDDSQGGDQATGEAVQNG